MDYREEEENQLVGFKLNKSRQRHRKFLFLINHLKGNALRKIDFVVPNSINMGLDLEKLERISLEEDIKNIKIDCSKELKGILKKPFKKSVRDIELTKGEVSLSRYLTDERAEEIFHRLGIEYPIPVPEEMKDYCKPMPK